MKNDGNLDQILKSVKKRNIKFGKALRTVRKAKNVSLRKMAGSVKKSFTYISDVEREIIKPPQGALLKEIVEVLRLNDTETEMEIRNRLYDLAAKERGEVAADINKYIMKNEELRVFIRMAQQQNKRKEFWKECVDKMQ